MAQTERLDLRLDSRLEEASRAAAEVDALFARHGLAEETASLINLCCDELITNVILHGLGGEPGRTIELNLVLDGEVLHGEIVDDGPAFDPLSRDDVDIDQGVEEREIGGLGVHLVRTVMDAVSYRRADGRNRFSFSKRVGAEAPR